MKSGRPKIGETRLPAVVVPVEVESRMRKLCAILGKSVPWFRREAYYKHIKEQGEEADQVMHSRLESGPV